MFHVSQLRQARGAPPVYPVIPPQLTADMELQVEPKVVLDIRKKPTSSPGDFEVLLKWKNLPDFEATWEDYYTIQHQFPNFHLEDKVNVWVGVKLDHQFA